VIYCDGGAKHPALEGGRKALLDRLAGRGVGLGFMHYGVEVPANNGGPEFLRWIGGHYETNYSCNPMWSPDYRSFPDHPVARGVKPFSNRDEWDGGRGFGFTGGHTHKNWGDDNQRKVVLNALLWLAKAEVPKNGVESTVTPEQLAANLDPKPTPAAKKKQN